MMFIGLRFEEIIHEGHKLADGILEAAMSLMEAPDQDQIEAVETNSRSSRGGTRQCNNSLMHKGSGGV